MQPQTPKLPYTYLFVHELALAFDPPEEVCRRHGVTPEEFHKLENYEPFKEALARAAKEIINGGVTTEIKAKLALERAVDAIVTIMNDTTAEPETRLKAIERLEKIAKVDKDGPKQSGFQLQIHIGQNGPAKAVTITPGNVGVFSEPPPGVDDQAFDAEFIEIL